MKHQNTLEEQLRSWKPRRPSPKIERRLFGTRHFSITLPRLAGILTPTMACLMVTVSLWRQVGQPILNESGSQTAAIAMSMSNQNYAPYLATSFQPTANRLDTFGWTNRGYSKSSVPSFTPQKGN
jgi:hypothetical protein